MLRVALSFGLVSTPVTSPRAQEPSHAHALRYTTHGDIALENLDHLIARRGDDGVVDLLLARARYRNDAASLMRAAALAEVGAHTSRALTQRARARAAAHRFNDALADLDAAATQGASSAELAPMRAIVQVAQGRVADALPTLEREAAQRPAYASYAALAAAYAEIGRYDEADCLYQRAGEQLQTTSPLPHAWLDFARGAMWCEQADDCERGAAHYRRAIERVPGYAAANLHLAEIEAGHGDETTATARLERLLADVDDPEARALLATLRLRAGDIAASREHLRRAVVRFEVLLDALPLAYADHAAAFFLGPGASPARALELARVNLANRSTARARDLFEAASRANPAR